MSRGNVDSHTIKTASERQSDQEPTNLIFHSHSNIWAVGAAVDIGAESILTTDPKEEVAAVHPKAMPVILRTRDEIECWMSAPVEDALKLQRPSPDGSLKIVAKGVKKDGNAD
jgi:putative SOS response-associated peptidase YedK